MQPLVEFVPVYAQGVRISQLLEKYLTDEELLDERRVDEPPATLPPDGDDIL